MNPERPRRVCGGKRAGCARQEGITEELQIQNKELIVSKELLRQSETRLIQAERVAMIGNWTLQLHSRTIVASDGARAIYGMDFQKVSLADLQKVALTDYRPILDKALSDLVSKSIPYDLEFKIKRQSDGKVVDIHSVAALDKKTDAVFLVLFKTLPSKKSQS